MKILFLCHKIPFPPNKGDRIPTYHRIKFLAQKHKLYLAFPCFYKDELKYLKELGKYSDSIHTVVVPIFWAKVRSIVGFFTNRSLTLPYFYSHKLQRKINRLLRREKFDLIYVYSSSMAQYVMKVTDTKKIMDFADADSHKWLQYSDHILPPLAWIYYLEYLKMRFYERKVAENFDHTISISEDEKHLFGSYIKNLKMDVVPNGVDLEYFQPSANEYNPKQLVFVGAMDYFPNVDAVRYFCEDILPLIKREVPDVKFYIVGSRPTEAVKKLSDDKNVIVTDFVKDTRPYLVNSAACVAPLRIARGIQNKILEAMAAGVPVVTSVKGNEGINANIGESIFVEDRAKEFSQRVIKLMKDPGLRNRVKQNARKFVEINHNWQVNLEKFESILGKIGTDPE